MPTIRDQKRGGGGRPPHHTYHNSLREEGTSSPQGSSSAFKPSPASTLRRQAECSPFCDFTLFNDNTPLEDQSSSSPRGSTGYRRLKASSKNPNVDSVVAGDSRYQQDKFCCHEISSWRGNHRTHLSEPNQSSLPTPPPRTLVLAVVVLVLLPVATFALTGPNVCSKQETWVLSASRTNFLLSLGVWNCT